jgi:transcriptional regulator with XRE-family HTH domain
MHPASTVRRARTMRAGGSSLSEVARRLSISKGTASLWLRDMPLDPKLAAERRRAAGWTGLGGWAHKAALERASDWRTEAVSLWAEHKDNSQFLLGIGLYWGEGSKTSKTFVLSNSDPALARCWVSWCSRFTPDIEYEVRIIARSDINTERARAYWRRVTGCRVASHVSLIPAKNGATVKALYGTAHIRACRGASECYVKMMTWLGLLKKHKF